jgi:hypothetical protein
MHHLPLHNGLTCRLTEHNGQGLDQSFLAFVCRQLCAMCRPETDIMCFNLLQIARTSYWSFWMSISSVWIFCVLKCRTNVNRQRGKNPIHENATRMLLFGVPIPTVPSHDPIAIVVGVALWTFVHITRAGSIHIGWAVGRRIRPSATEIKTWLAADKTL